MFCRLITRFLQPTLLIVLSCSLRLVTQAAESRPVGPGKIPVIFDTDIGSDIDDTWALALLLKSPELDLKLAVSETGDTVYRAKIIAKMLEVAKRTNVPVGIGLSTKKSSLTPGKTVGRQAKWVDNYDLTKYPGKLHEDGVAAMIDLIMNSPERITLICVGPLPNIRAALERQPQIAQRANFVGMHGSVRVGYGSAAKPSAEYNVRGDVRACQAAFTAAWPMLITPLDTCGLVRLQGEKYQQVARSGDPLARAVIENYEMWAANRGKDNKEKQPGGKPVASSVLFDTVAVCLAYSTELVNVETLPLRVTDDGFTQIDPQGKPIRCATSWKHLPGFEDFLVQRLTAKE